jgi:phosphatidylserine/phosphatidylglycerophosphate/cardiolipin synthase-like enzyme
MCATCPQIEVCFTPGQDCTSEIIREVNSAQHLILVQAYNFTSASIAKSLIQAKQRGVLVRVILDKSQKTQRYSASTLFVNQHIPTWIDNKPAIAHNKIMIIDDEKVITGSFNFTASAQERNAENLLVIDDSNLAKLYTENWKKRQQQSVTLNASDNVSNNVTHKTQHRRKSDHLNWNGILNHVKKLI